MPKHCKHLLVAPAKHRAALQSSSPFIVVNKAFHGASITALDAQRFGTHIATAGQDHMVRIVDAISGNSVASFTVMDDITGIAMHPYSNLVLVAMHATLVLLEVTQCVANPASIPPQPHQHTSCGASGPWDMPSIKAPNPAKVECSRILSHTCQAIADALTHASSHCGCSHTCVKPLQMILHTPSHRE
jgi:hypothetical protein